MLNVDHLFQQSIIFSTQSLNTLMHLSNPGKFYNSEEVEMAIHEWLRL